MICRNCKEEINNNTSDVEDVCYDCVQKIVCDYFEYRVEEDGEEFVNKVNENLGLDRVEVKNE